MSIKKTIGGDRLGSGKKMTTTLHRYERSTHDLSRVWRSTMQVGVLTPCFIELLENGETMEMKITHKMLTAPTNGPTFGAFKIQIDMFTGPMRLWNGLLHNNAVKVGMDMSQVKFPRILMQTTAIDQNTCETNGINFETHQIAPDSLPAYLGIRGLGTGMSSTNNTIMSMENISEYYNAMPFLMYYDIFKIYYSNKQETNGYVIMPDVTKMDATSIDSFEKVKTAAFDKNTQTYVPIRTEKINTNAGTAFNLYKNRDDGYSNLIWIRNINYEDQVVISGSVDTTVNGTEDTRKYTNMPLDIIAKNKYIFGDGVIYDINPSELLRAVSLAAQAINNAQNIIVVTINEMSKDITYYNSVDGASLQPFPLENIDTVRRLLLAQQKGVSVNWTSPTSSVTDTAIGNLLPYKSLTGRYVNKALKTIAGKDMYTHYPIHHMCGLCVKTYQSDIFNNWLNSEWITGTNGISAITNIDTTNGVLNLDILNLHQKTYNILNRIAVAGGTFEDWQEAVFGVDAIRRVESPVYQGGASSHLIFDEVISTGGNTPLGTLAGKGQTINQKGGKLYIKANEPEYVMGIASITPLIDYSQGNKWFTKLTSMEDLHKPGLDRIGYQNLMTWRLAWWDRYKKTNAPLGSEKEYSAGKLPVWIEYQTAVNECFGEFAEENKMMYMTLNRRYQPNNINNGQTVQSRIKDLTSYIDPTKYNYIFAVTELEAQNFWMQIYFDCKVRRLGSANQIPNL